MILLTTSPSVSRFRMKNGTESPCEWGEEGGGGGGEGEAEWERGREGRGEIRRGTYMYVHQS